MTVIDTKDSIEDIDAVAKHLPDTPVAPAHAIAGLALAMAMKYHQINTVQDGTLYQQYKLEGRNMVPLHLDMVFETAIAIERHLLGASERIAKLVVDAIEFGADEAEAPAQEGDEHAIDR